MHSIQLSISSQVKVYIAVPQKVSHNTAALTRAVEALVAPEHPLGVMDAAKSVSSSLLVDDAVAELA